MTSFVFCVKCSNMNKLLELIQQPWPWYVAGPVIAFVMFFLVMSDKRLGLSSNLRTMCSMLGAGKNCDFFDFDWKASTWNLVFVVGLIIGGFISHNFLSPNDEVQLSAQTVVELQAMGFAQPGAELIPKELFGWDNLLTSQGFIIIILGGFLVGFGTRYAGGCTSGHAISGLSNLQLPSLIAVIGFFVGGLLCVHLIFPLIF